MQLLVSLKKLFPCLFRDPDFYLTVLSYICFVLLIYYIFSLSVSLEQHFSLLWAWFSNTVTRDAAELRVVLYDHGRARCAVVAPTFLPLG